MYCNDGHIRYLPQSGGVRCAPQSCQIAGAAVPPEGGLEGTCGVAELEHGTSCSRECAAGTTAVGSGVLSCTLGIVDSDTDYACTADACLLTMPPPAGGTMGTCGPSLTSGASCDRECTGGYASAGSSSVSCFRGLLTAADYSCTASPCSLLAVKPPHGGSMGTCEAKSIASGNGCDRRCPDGHEVNGGSLGVTCLLGSLTYDAQTVCSPLPCTL